MRDVLFAVLAMVGVVFVLLAVGAVVLGEWGIAALAAVAAVGFLLLAAAALRGGRG